MKLSFKKLSLFFFLSLMAGFLGTSCEKDDVDTDIGNPTVKYIRSTDPAAADSLLVSAFMGSLIAIMGEDLDYTVELWFNDQRATLNPTYVTNETIIVNVPSTVPLEVTDKIRFVFSNGEEMLYDFFVDVPGPKINSIKCEHVVAGDIAVLKGDFFFEPTTVTFAGGAQAEIVVLEKTQLQVVVPEGAEMGEILVETNFGVAKSGFLFRDDRNMVANFDDLLSRSWNSPVADVAGGTAELPPCSGNYTYFKMDGVGAWQWANALNMMYIAEDGETGRGNIPIFPSDANIPGWGVRFEANVAFEWSEPPIEIFFAPYGADHGRDNAVIAHWTPFEDSGSFQTDGWITVTIPLTDFDADSGGNPAEIDDLSVLTNLTIMLFGPANGASDVHFGIDNVRVVRL